MADTVDVIPGEVTENIMDQYKVVWWDCGCEIICPCGNNLILNDGQRELCDCGRVWLLETRLIRAERR
jgi:hypothetical protein